MGLFKQLKEEAQARNLKFLIIGGLAVNLYGYSRDTADLDLLVCRDDCDGWLQFFATLGYTVDRNAEAFVQLSPPKAGAWPVDLMIVRAPTFRELFAQAQQREIYGEQLLVPALEHLIALKLHTLKHSHTGRFLKDYLDVENLLRINQVDMRADKVRQIFLKYGTLELYEKLSRTSARE